MSLPLLLSLSILAAAPSEAAPETTLASTPTLTTQALRAQAIGAGVALGTSLATAGTVAYVVARGGGRPLPAFIDTSAAMLPFAMPAALLATDAVVITPRRDLSWAVMLATAGGWLVGAGAGALYLAPLVEPQQCANGCNTSVARGAAFGAAFVSLLAGASTSIALAEPQELE